MIKTKKDMSNNEFYTFRKHIIPLVKILKQKNIKIIWCPADTLESNFVKVLNEYGFFVVFTHISKGEDFMTYEPKFKFDIIITNPPYDTKREWVKKCIDHGKPWILLLPQPILMNKIIKMNSREISYIYFSKRISFFTPKGDIVSPADTLYVTYGLDIKNDVIDVDKLEKGGVKNETNK